MNQTINELAVSAAETKLGPKVWGFTSEVWQLSSMVLGDHGVALAR